MTPIQALRANEGYTHVEPEREVKGDERFFEAVENAPDLEAAHAQDDQPLPWHAAAFEWVLMNPYAAMRYAAYAIAATAFVIAWLTH